MSKPVIHGFPQSSFVWTARATAALKGVDYEFVPLKAGDHKSAEHLVRHPFGKVPSFTHGDVALYETTAITRYIDEAFPGPALQPSDPIGRAHMEQWMSIVSCYMYNAVVLNFLFPLRSETPDRAVIDAAKAQIRLVLGQLDKAIGSDTWIAGKAISLADLTVGPLLFVLGILDEGKPLLAEHQNVMRLLGALKETQGFMAAAPPQG